MRWLFLRENHPRKRWKVIVKLICSFFVHFYFIFTTRHDTTWWIAKIIVVEKWKLPSFYFLFIPRDHRLSLCQNESEWKKRPDLNCMAYPICKISWWQQILLFFLLLCVAVSSIFIKKQKHSKCSSKWDLFLCRRVDLIIHKHCRMPCRSYKL